MTRILLAAAFLLAAGTASAQTPTTPADPAKPSIPAAGATPTASPNGDGPRAGEKEGRVERGAFIKIRRAGMSVAVRCADGESTKTCGETVMQLVEKLAAQGGGERKTSRDDRDDRDDDDDRPRYRDRDRDRDRDGYGDRRYY